MDPVEQPPAVGLLSRPYDRHRLRHAGIRVRARPSEVVERAQHVVVPVVGERELEVLGIDHLAGAQAAEQAALQQILLTATTGRAHVVRTAGRAFEARAGRRAR